MRIDGRPLLQQRWVPMNAPAACLASALLTELFAFELPENIGTQVRNRLDYFEHLAKRFVQTRKLLGFRRFPATQTRNSFVTP